MKHYVITQKELDELMRSERAVCVACRQVGAWHCAHPEDCGEIADTPIARKLRALKPVETDELRERKDGAYEERNRLVALLASLFPSGLAKTAIEGWDDEWHNCVYIDLPTGQASWHVHDSQMHLFDGLPPYPGEWDGHTTDEKYERVSKAIQQAKGA